MGFDQYHEPPEELPAQIRTFARLCAALTEEAEAIGWYVPRLAGEGVGAAQRRVLPLVELRADFSLAREEIRAGDRGAEDVELADLDESARRIARAENVAVFHGFGPAGIVGITEASSHDPIALSEDFDAYPGDVAKALEQLRRVGVAGPYGLARGTAAYTGVIESTEHGG